MTFFTAPQVPRKTSPRLGSVIAARLIASIVEYRAVVLNRVVILSCILTLEQINPFCSMPNQPANKATGYLFTKCEQNCERQLGYLPRCDDYQGSESGPRVLTGSENRQEQVWS